VTAGDESAHDGSTSICTSEKLAPIRYHWYARGTALTFAQALQELLAGAGIDDADQDRVLGEVAARMKRLVRGQLVPVHHVKGPMETVKGIDVFEVRSRVELGDDISDVLVRAYHVEPNTFQRTGGSVVIGLHLHLKDVSDEAEVRAKQDDELQLARDYFFEGRASKWGVAVLS
jgi:hypothetical protein